MLMKKEVWLLIDSRTTGGIETHVHQLALGLQKTDTPTRVIFLNDYGPHPLKTQLAHASIPYETLDGKVTSLLARVTDAHAIVFHSHGYKANIYGRIVSRLKHIPIVSTYHSGDVGSGKLYLYGVIDRLTAPLSHKNYSVSKEIDDRIPTTTEVLDNFIDTDGLRMSKGKHIAFVGRLSNEKGPDLFIALARQFLDVNFYIYGDGPERESLEKHTSENVIFCGAKSSMENHWGDIDLLIMPSREEGLPMAALEAMARGIPVLATKVGQLDDLIDHNSNGWLIPPNSLQHLITSLNHWFLLQQEQKITIKNLAREKILHRYSTDIVIPKIWNTYNDIASW